MIKRNIQCIITPIDFKEDNIKDIIIDKDDDINMDILSKIKLKIQEKILNYDLEEWVKDEENIFSIFLILLFFIFIIFCSFLFKKYYITTCYSIKND